MQGEVWDILEEVIQEHPVLLNRAPTLHRLGIQAFEPTLVEGKAIQVHPLVCHAFNADFDGDQMAVHVPLSAEAQAEARILMLSSNNVLSPADGRPLATPSKDMVLGLYYLTYCRHDLESISVEDLEERPQRFQFEDDVIFAVEAEQVHLQEPIQFRRNGDLLLTTPGRVIFNIEVERALQDALADHEATLDPYLNRTLAKRGIYDFVTALVERHGATTLAAVLDTIKSLGFSYATRVGITLSKNDIVVPQEKEDILTDYEERVGQVEGQYERGLITEAERHEAITSIWTEATDAVADAMEANLHDLNPIMMMANSGARGSMKQIRQLAGMRGLIANPKGEIIERPIKSNFMEGLSVLEYFLSTHGARKGLADTALRTADSGYLTRRLVDVTQDVIVRESDCGTERGIPVTVAVRRPTRKKGQYEWVRPRSAESQGMSRVLAEDVLVQEGKGEKVLVEAGTEVDDEVIDLLVENGIGEIQCRSVLTCESRLGVCQLCYGRSLATNRLVDIGEAVGTIAAQ